MTACKKCGVELCEDNWYASHRKVSNKICKPCHRADCSAYAKSHPEKSRERTKRYVLRNKEKVRDKDKSRVKGIDQIKLAVDEAGKTCAKCGEELTVANWLPSARKRNIRRCRACHTAVCKEWAKRNPENQRRRTARWRLRNPDYAPRRYRENIESFKERARVGLWNIKSRAFLMLGGKCTCCGNDDIRVLQVNHKNGGGTKEKRHGVDMYKAILDGTRPIDDLDLRCANCNLIYEYERGKRHLPAGVDPHLGRLKIQEGAA